MIYITGASGFIGSHLMLAIRDNVVGCDITRDASMIAPNKLFAHMEKDPPSVIFHLGAISSTIENNTIKIVQNNIALSCQILEFCIHNKVPLVYASSASVYGHGSHGFGEDSQLTPLNYYAISKASFDMFVLQKIKDNPSARIVGLRYFNVYGPKEHHKGEMASPVYKFIEQARKNSEIRVFEGSENYKRDFVYVDDVVDITLAASRFNSSASGIYNVGTGVARSFREVADIIAHHMNARVIQVPFPPHLKGKYQNYTQSENGALLRAGYTAPRLSLEDGIKKVLTEI